MDVRVIPLLKTFVPRIPLILKTALYSILGWSRQSQYWDTKTEVAVAVLRSLLNDAQPSTISRLQELSTRDEDIHGRIWIAKVVLPRPSEDDVLQLLRQSIRELDASEAPHPQYNVPELCAVEAEWTGYRAGATAASPRLRGLEQQQYLEMMREVTTPVTVLYLHGGAYFLMDPISHRGTTKKLAKLTGGRCLSVRYRLAPRHPFPAALLDAFIAYLSLLYPPPDSFHVAVSPAHIVISGDSAGGGLCMALLQLIMSLQRRDATFRWHGVERRVALPAGAAVNSAWLDVLQSSPSYQANRDFDYLPVPSNTSDGMSFLPCELWPTNPVRSSPYASDTMLNHPLVSPLAAGSWRGCCPLYIVVGQEMLTDEGRYVARKAAKEGVPVVFEEYEAMPHCFALVFQGMKGARRCFQGWAGFIRTVTERPDLMTTRGTKFAAPTLDELVIDVESLTTDETGEVLRRMDDRRRKLLGTTAIEHSRGD